MNFVSRMLSAEKRQKVKNNSGIDINTSEFNPIYFTEDEIIRITNEMEVLSWCSSTVWGYSGYAGMMVPWHESDEKDRLVRFQNKILVDLMRKLADIDVSVRAYGILTAFASDYNRFERPAFLFKQPQMLYLMGNLRKYVCSREMVDRVADFMLDFVKMQVEFSGNGQVIVKDILYSIEGKKSFYGYKIAADRLFYYDKLGVDYKEWMREKFLAFKEWKPNERLGFKPLVNANNLDPSDTELIKLTSDPWMPIRRFLGVNDECQFPDGFIPKGWQAAVDDFDRLDKVSLIKGDGFYYYDDGTQRRGKRHYARNKYLIIRASPFNFLEYKENWNNTKLITGNPTWEEYRDFGVYPDMWDIEGNSSHYAVKPLKWRKKS